MIVVAFLGNKYFFVDKLEEEYTEDAIERNNQITTNAKIYLEKELDNYFMIIPNLEQRINLFNKDGVFDLQEYEEFAASNKSIDGLEIADEEGKIVLSTLFDSNRVGLTLADEDLFLTDIELHTLAIGGINYNDHLGGLTLEVSYSYEL